MEKTIKKLEKKIERKKFLVGKIRSFNEELNVVEDEIKRLEQEKKINEMDSLEKILSAKNLKISDIKKAIENENLELIEEKIIEGVDKGE